MIRTGLVFFSIIFLISCKKKDTAGNDILKPGEMQAVLWDVIKADAFAKEIVIRDTAKKIVDENLKLQQQIFTIHHISKEKFYKSYDYYKSKPGLLKEIMDSIIVQTQRARLPQ